MKTEAISFMNSPAVRITTSNGSEAIVMLHGAQVVSWKPKGSTERIYLSDKADFSPGSAIRGGIPVCFPQFSSLGSGPFHGFVRNMEWKHADTLSDSDSVKAVLKLSDTPETQAFWPHAFRASLIVDLSDTALEVALEVTNTGAEAFSFTTALHTYLRIANIEEIAIEGLKGTTYLDKVANLENQTEPRQTITFSGQTDRVYYNAPTEILLHEGDRDLTLQARNMADAVIWNPWEERSIEIPDLPDDGYRYMVCIEAGNIGNPVELAAGKTWKGSQRLTA